MDFSRTSILIPTKPSLSIEFLPTCLSYPFLLSILIRPYHNFLRKIRRITIKGRLKGNEKKKINKTSQ